MSHAQPVPGPWPRRAPAPLSPLSLRRPSAAPRLCHPIVFHVSSLEPIPGLREQTCNSLPAATTSWWPRLQDQPGQTVR